MQNVKFNVGDVVRYVDSGKTNLLQYGETYLVHGVFKDSFTNEYIVRLTKSNGEKLDGSWLANRFELVEPRCDVDTIEQLQNTDRYKTTSGKQLFDVMKDDLLEPDEYTGFLKGNIYKYVKRYKHKNGVADLQKAEVYLKELIKLEETKDEKSI